MNPCDVTAASKRARSSRFGASAVSRDGVNVATCQPGIFHISQEARLPIVPIFIENMQLISTKTGRFHLLAGWRKVEAHFGEAIAPEKYLALPREEFTEFVREKILDAKSR